jgi:hypothetical protein
MTMPAMISSTTDGSLTPGNNPRANGIAKATATTISSPPNEGIVERCLEGRIRYTGTL